MIEIPTPRRRLRRGFGCLAVVALAPMMFGCLNVIVQKIRPFGWALFVLALLIAIGFVWLGRQRA